MRQPIDDQHWLDHNNNPAGGISQGRGILVSWQNGPLGRGAERKEPNGAFVEGVIQAARRRLMFYQEACGGRFACAENERAIEHLSAALDALEERTIAREVRQVEGEHVA